MVISWPSVPLSICSSAFFFYLYFFPAHLMKNFLLSLPPGSPVVQWRHWPLENNLRESTPLLHSPPPTPTFCFPVKRELTRVWVRITRKVWNEYWLSVWEVNGDWGGVCVCVKGQVRCFWSTWIPARVQVSVGGGRPLGPLQLAVSDSLRPITFPLGVMNDDVINGFPLGGSN